MQYFSKKIAIICFGIFIAAQPLAAQDEPVIVADLAPIHGLVSLVMKGGASPKLLIEPRATAHDMVLRPSQASALQEADLVILNSRDFMPSLSNAVEKLVGEGKVLDLMAQADTLKLAMRDKAIFEQDDHHDDHKDAHHDDHHGHAHQIGDVDLHGWLDPQNAVYWLDVITDRLSALSPEHATRYQENAAQAKAEIKALQEAMAQLLMPAHDTSFVVVHDSLGYIENRFDVHVVGALSDGMSEQISPSRLAQLTKVMEEHQPICAIIEPDTKQAIAKMLAQASGKQTVTIDLFGSDFEMGAGLYPKLMMDITQKLVACTKPS